MTDPLMDKFQEGEEDAVVNLIIVFLLAITGLLLLGGLFLILYGLGKLLA